MQLWRQITSFINLSLHFVFNFCFSFQLKLTANMSFSHSVCICVQTQNARQNAKNGKESNHIRDTNSAEADSPLVHGDAKKADAICNLKESNSIMQSKGENNENYSCFNSILISMIDWLIVWCKLQDNCVYINRTNFNILTHCDKQPKDNAVAVTFICTHHVFDQWMNEQVCHCNIHSTSAQRV